VGGVSSTFKKYDLGSHKEGEPEEDSKVLYISGALGGHRASQAMGIFSAATPAQHRMDSRNGKGEVGFTRRNRLRGFHQGN